MRTRSKNTTNPFMIIREDYISCYIREKNNIFKMNYSKMQKQLAEMLKTCNELSSTDLLLFLEDQNPHCVSILLKTRNNELLKKLRENFITYYINENQEISSCIRDPLSPNLIYRRDLIKYFESSFDNVDYNMANFAIETIWMAESNKIKLKYFMKAKVHNLIHKKL